VNDEELGRMLGTALAAPPLQAAPDAGVRLRARAHRRRTERLASGAAVAVVLVLLTTLGAVRIATDRPAPGIPTATPSVVGPEELATAAASSPVRRLHTPLTLWLGPDAQKIQWPPCGPGNPGQPVYYCQKRLMMFWDEVAELRVTGSEVAARLLPADAANLERVVHPMQRSDLVVRLDTGSRSLRARYTDGVVQMTAPTSAQAHSFVAAARPYRPRIRTGPGPLQTRLQVRPASSVCRDGQPGLWRECLSSGQPVVATRTADLQVLRTGPRWTLRIGLTAADTTTLARWSAGHVGQRILYMAPRADGGVGMTVDQAILTTVPGRMTSIEIPVIDAGDALVLISRLRA
jgi:hypothetical protein